MFLRRVLAANTSIETGESYSTHKDLHEHTQAEATRAEFGMMNHFFKEIEPVESEGPCLGHGKLS
jgi:hypothetical protein